MNKQLKILFLGKQQPVADQLLSQFGNITYGNGNSYTGYDLVALEGSSYTEDFQQLFNAAWTGGSSIGVLNITPEQAAIVADVTGISPSGTPQGVLAARETGNNVRQVRYLLKYPQPVLDLAAKDGISEEDLMGQYMTAGLEAHFAALQAGKENVSGPAPTNNLVPQYSQVPFSVVRIPAKHLSQNVGSMYNQGNLTMVVSSQLYCYHQNGAGNNNFIVIIVSQLNNVSNGNPVTYSKTEHHSCGNCYYSYEWDHYFHYSLTVTALDSRGNPFSTGLSIYDSSPAKAKHGQKSIVDSIGIPDPVTIYMQVLNNGTWQLANFPASYTNTINTETVKWFNITSLNDQSNAAAGVEFNMPTNVTGDHVGEKSPKQVNFEVITAFSFDGALVSGGKLPVTFRYSMDMRMTQEYYQSVNCGNPGPPNETTTHGGDTPSFKTDTYDLVQLTQNQSPAS
ncbi:MAG TPA: hypothetical protein VD996_13950 [Chitinophagaceae bacterium]|nr:hypothetical protein [Chitinophagaceae bacterium]